MFKSDWSNLCDDQNFFRFKFKLFCQKISIFNYFCQSRKRRGVMLMAYIGTESHVCPTPHGAVDSEMTADKKN
jgi:hypothetical protein